MVVQNAYVFALFRHPRGGVDNRSHHRAPNDHRMFPLRKGAHGESGHENRSPVPVCDNGGNRPAPVLDSGPL